MELGRQRLKDFPWANWPNYLHRTIEHVQKIIETKGSLGALFAEGSEGNNKQTRLFRSLRSRTSSAANSMDDFLQLCWLLGSKKLQKHSETSVRAYHCSKCGECEHSSRTCPVFDSDCDE